MRALFSLGLLLLAALTAGAESSEITSRGRRETDLPGELEVKAMSISYPERVEEIGVRGGEWALKMDGSWYHWAEGRLLPAEHLDGREEFASIRFYTRYRFGPAVEREISPELEARLRERANIGGRDRRSRFNGFLDKLYQVSSRREAEETMERVDFLGMSTRVHPMVVEPLARVEKRLIEAAAEDEALALFLDELRELHGYNWRNIAGTNRRSYHSYGIAVDILPGNYRGGWAYWLWAAQSGYDSWWNLPLRDRWQLPQPIIDAFEAEGFIWGGKWLFFDNIHFEYRPESILLARWRWAREFPGRWLRESEGS